MDRVKKRDRLEVIHDILHIVRNKGAIKPTPLLRFSNLSSKGFAEYYKELLEKEFLREEFDKKKRKHIVLTDKGYNYLEKYTMIRGFMQEFDLE